jgi:hypothetical protein
MRRTLALAIALPLALVLLDARPDAGDDIAWPPGTMALDVATGTGPSSAAAAEGTGPAAPSDTPDSTGPGLPGPAGATADPPPSGITLPPSRPGEPGMSPAPSSGTEAGVSMRSREGFLVAAGTSQGGSGTTWRYTVEVEPATALDPAEVVAIVEEALLDPRSWARDRTLVRVEDPSLARIRIVVATPGTVDDLCAQAGLRTVGRFSCWNGRVAALNSMRWEAGADGFPDLATYHRYLVNHEFGHGLGYGHVDCAAPGALAPVMMQQTMRLGGCVANGWPHP